MQERVATLRGGEALATGARGCPAAVTREVPSALPIRARSLAIFGLLALALIAIATTLLAYAPTVRRGLGPVGASRARVQAQRNVLSLPSSARALISSALGAGNPAYRVEPTRSGTLTASGPAHALHSVFTAHGVSVSTHTAHISIALQSIGFGSALTTLGRARPSARANRVTYRRTDLNEWYANGPLGLEQGFTIARAPGVPARGPLTLSLAFASNGTLSLGDGSQAITLLRRGRPVLRYGGLAAVDAGGRKLPSRMAVEAGSVRLLIDARGARYPIHVDPFFEQGEPLSNGVEAGRFGESVAVSEHGEYALIGAPDVAEGVGAAYVFKRSGSGAGETWSLEATLTGSGEAGKALFGRSVALSADGSTALVGGSLDSSEGGAAWVFTRSGEAWSQQGGKLTPEGTVQAGQFGHSVALSSDGSTALIGAPANNEFVGAAWVFTRSGEAWSQQSEKLTGSGEVGQGEFGCSVAISGSGDEALVGAKKDTPTEKGGSGEGAAWVFTRSASVWTQLGGKLTDPLLPPGAEFGAHVALSGDGATALFSAQKLHTGGSETAWAFARSGESFHSESALEGAFEESFGESVALSGDGNTALVGARTAWVYTRSGETWTRQGHVRTGTAAKFGWEVAVAADASVAVIGAPEAHEAGVFVNLPEGTLPEVSGVSPAGGALAGGTTVTISGSGFTGATTVSFGSAAASSFSVGSEHSITAVSPPGAFGAVDVRVGTAVGTSLREPADRFSYGPSVSGVAPEGGTTAGGTTVTITGADLSGATAVTFGETPAASFAVNSDTSITAVSPKGTGSVDVRVTNGEGTSPANTADLYYFTPPPSIEKVKPAKGPVTGNTKVEITGPGVGGRGVEVKFGTAAGLSFKALSSTAIVGYTPPEPAGTVPVTVTTLGGTSTFTKGFKFQPIISSLSPNSGPTSGGTSVTVKGAGFATGASGTVFKFGTARGTAVSCVSSTECTVTAPAHSAGTVDVLATVNKVTSAKSTSDRFTYS